MEYTYSQFEGDAQREPVKSPRKWKVFSKKFGKNTADGTDRRDATTNRDYDEQSRDSAAREERKVVTSEEKEISLLNDKGNEFFVRGEFNGALRMYSEALKLLKNPVVITAESRSGMMDTAMRRFHTARLLVNIGAVHIRRECYEDAMSSLELSIRSSKLIPEKSVHYYRSLEVLSDALENLGLVYYKEKDLVISLAMYNDALDARRSCLDLLEQKWKSRLIKSKDEVRKINEEKFACKMELASTVQQIALLEERQGNIGKAIERCEEAVALRKEVSPEVDESSLTLLNALGRLYSHRSVGWYKEALNNFEKVYEVKSELHDGEDHIDVVPSINNIAYVHGELGNHRQCLNLSDRAIDICTTGRGISKETVAAYTNKGYTLYSMGDNQEALAAYKLALDFLSKCAGDTDLMGATLHQKMSEVYIDMGHVDDAISSIESLIEAKSEVLGGESKELALPFKELGDCYEMTNELTLCIKCHTRSLRIYKHHNDKEGAAKQHNKIAGIHKKKGNREESIDHYMAALWHSREAKLPSTDPTVADTIKNVAAFQNYQNRGMW